MHPDRHPQALRHLHAFLGRAPSMRPVGRVAHAAAAARVPLLLLGETGTGKTLLARILHRMGPWSGAPFILVNAAAIPEALFESELFGHARGAFTGATGSRRGLIEAAQGGTFVLDEIGDLPASQQSKLLSVLEDGEIRRIGEERAVPVDIRLISASCIDLEGRCADGRFRPDLYHRIALLRCRLPPLRDRAEDLLPMAEEFRVSAVRRHGIANPGFSPGARHLLASHPWPGNIRELRHVVEAGVILSGPQAVDEGVLADLLGVPGHLASAPEPDPGPAGDRSPKVDSVTSGDLATPGFPAAWGDLAQPGESAARSDSTPPGGSPDPERDRVIAALRVRGGDLAAAARDLGMSRSKLRDRVIRWSLPLDRGSAPARGSTPARG